MLKFVHRLLARFAEVSEPRDAGPGPRLPLHHHFDFHVERRPPLPGVTAVGGLGEIDAVFQRDAARCKAKSIFGTSRPIPTNDTALGHDLTASDSDQWLR